MDEDNLPGMGAIISPEGVGFRVWAPHASSVAVLGEFNDWHQDADLMERDDAGYWYAFVPGAAVGQKYKFWLTNGDDSFARRDPYASEVTNSVGDSIIYDHGAFDWEDTEHHCPPFHELVIYELHVGSFNKDDGSVGTLYDVIDRFQHIQDLGANAIQIMPVAEFAGDVSWGYNPADPFAVESAYGGPDALKTLVREAH
ncbi:MAG TPA: alpha-amylase family glycosyl hydrolase, partial [Propionibacteriaceae bacterium]|nr:alpha-amylase family glycosyl hydrolase [Propionibacteriaceae bacterium]